jgi:hypothetical protein
MKQLKINNSNYIESKIKLDFEYFPKVHFEEHILNIDFVRYYKGVEFNLILFEIDKPEIKKIEYEFDGFFNFKKMLKNKFIIGFYQGQISNEIEKHTDVLFDTKLSMELNFYELLDSKFVSFFGLKNYDYSAIIDNFLLSLHKCFIATSEDVCYDVVKIYNIGMRNKVQNFLDLNKDEFDNLLMKHPDKLLKEFSYFECEDFCTKFLYGSKIHFLNYLIGELL